MQRSSHVMLSGDGAIAFLQGKVPFEDQEYFETERRWRALQNKLANQRDGKLAPLSDQDRHGTVGAVAMDAGGGLAAATSTGGVTAKLPGRVGDSPLIGARHLGVRGVRNLGDRGRRAFHPRRRRARRYAPSSASPARRWRWPRTT